MKIAMIGAGIIARRHLKVLAAEPDVEIAAHVAPTPEHADTAAAQWGGRPYTTCQQLLNREQIDAAWICVPPAAHGEAELALIERGIPFFVEKPLDGDCRTAERIQEALDRSGPIAAVGYHWRAMETIAEVRRTLSENPARMVLGAWHSFTPPPAWWRQHDLSGGQMVEQATHLFDLARLLIGEASVVSASARRHERPQYPDADVASVSAALLAFETGALGSFTATCLLRGLAAVHLQLVCEGLLITITEEGVTYQADQRSEVRNGNNPFAAEDRAFLTAVRSGDRSGLYSTYGDALRTQRLACDVRRAAGDERG